MKSSQQGTRPPVLIVHGGTWDIPEEMHQHGIEGCCEAAFVGREVLTRGGSALDAVEAAVRTLEDNPTFDAGYGSVLNARGEVELDAMIMDGRDLNLGAVMAVKRVRHPITLARLVMTDSEHTILVSQGAETFAADHGLPLCTNWDLIVAREREHYNAARGLASHACAPHLEAKNQSEPHLRLEPGDTVGAVALDARGHLAAATSTGGTFNKHPGRVGDSPLVGCGAYADDRVGAVSATGDGEDLMKIVISKSICDFLDRGMTAQEAADAALSLLAQRTGGRGGVIVLDRQGDVGVAHNTPYLVYAHVTAAGEIVSRMSSISDIHQA
jgi:beta-aspartyl-peptidase (threonine type)